MANAQTGAAAKKTAAKPAKAEEPKVAQAAEKKEPPKAAPKAAKKAEAKAEPKAAEKKAEPKKAVIKIDKEFHHGAVPVGVNGRIRKLPVGVDVSVDPWELSALNDSNVRYDVISPATGEEGSVEGSAEPSTVIIGTAANLDAINPTPEVVADSSATGKDGAPVVVGGDEPQVDVHTEGGDKA